MATPWASMSGLARRSSAASAVSSTASSSASMLVPCLAEMSTNMVSPPKSSATRPYSVSCGRILCGIGALLVDLVDRHHDRHVGGLGVVDRLHRLRHHAVVGRDHQDRDVGGLRTAGTHGGERLVTRGVDEGDQPLVAVELGGDLVGADVLGDAAGLALADVGLADGVEQSGLAVVDVTHDGDDRRTELEILLVALVLAVGEVERLQQLAVLVLRGDDLHDVVHLAAEQLEGLVAHRLGGGDHLAEVEQRLHQRGRVGVDLLGEVGQRRAAGEPDGLAVAVRQPHATDDGACMFSYSARFARFDLRPRAGRAAGTTEGAGGTAALTGTATAATATAGTTAETAAAGRGGAATAAGATGAAAAVVTAAAAATGTTARHRGRRDRGRRRPGRGPPPGRPAGTGPARRAGRGGMLPGVAPPGRGPPPGRGTAGTAGAGRGPCGTRGRRARPAGCEENGLLPTRGGRGRPGLGAPGRVAGRGAGPGAGAGPRLRPARCRQVRRRAGAGAAGARRGCRAGPPVLAAGAAGFGAAGGAAGAGAGGCSGAAGLAGEPLPALAVAFCGGGLRRRRTTRAAGARRGPPPSTTRT